MHFYTWRLVTFEPLEFEQRYIPHLKALMCGIKASEAQWRGSTLRVCQALLKSAVLLSEIAKRLTFIFGNCNSNCYPVSICSFNETRRWFLRWRQHSNNSSLLLSIVCWSAVIIKSFSLKHKSHDLPPLENPWPFAFMDHFIVKGTFLPLSYQI